MIKIVRAEEDSRCNPYICIPAWTLRDENRKVTTIYKLGLI
jgi:hypothetical protein